MKYFLIIIGLSILSGCGNDVNFSTNKQDITAVYFHEHSRYSVATVINNNLIIKELPYKYGRVPVTITTDISVNEQMWYKCEGSYNTWTVVVTGGCEIHIRDTNDIDTGSWNHGKFGTGRTVRIDE
jgi:hypothetical protein